MSRKAIPMIGRMFGKLLVVSEAQCSTPKNKIYLVKCQGCDSEKEMMGGNIRRAASKGSSGCKCSTKAIKHGLHDHPAYKTWEGMISRCHNRGHVAFHNYGGRGIEVCSAWRETPSAFVAWAENNGFAKDKQIDRIDNDSGYSPENCRFVTQTENMNNRSTNRYLVVDGKRMTVSEAAREYGLNKTTVKERLNRGWSDQDSVRAVRSDV